MGAIQDGQYIDGHGRVHNRDGSLAAIQRRDAGDDDEPNAEAARLAMEARKRTSWQQPRANRPAPAAPSTQAPAQPSAASADDPWADLARATMGPKEALEARINRPRATRRGRP